MAFSTIVHRVVLPKGRLCSACPCPSLLRLSATGGSSASGIQHPAPLHALQRAFVVFEHPSHPRGRRFELGATVDLPPHLWQTARPPSSRNHCGGCSLLSLFLSLSAGARSSGGGIRARPRAQLCGEPRSAPACPCATKRKELSIQGYLAHKKQRPLRILMWPMPRVLGGSQGRGRFLMSEVPL